jgi:hypothetical protein
MFANRTEITSEQVRRELLADPDAPWHEYRGRGPITKHQIAALLKEYDTSGRPSSDAPSGFLAARLQGSAIRGFVRAFLPSEANIRTLKRKRSSGK